MKSYLKSLAPVRRGELAPLLIATFYFFCVLSALMVLRPARDALGMRRGMDDIRWLFVGTALITLAVNPVFGWLVSRFRRITFITITYGFFALSLVGFFNLLKFAPEAVGEISGMVFYVWFSVFNLFCTMLFWAQMVDCFTLEQSKRLFGVIAVGGTLGAIFGPWLAGILAEPMGTAYLLLVAATLLVLSVTAALVLARMQTGQHGIGDAARQPERAAIGGNAWGGIRAVVQSRYLLGISAYMLVLSVIATFLYFTRLKMVQDLGGTTDQDTAVLARIDLITQSATLILQFVAAGYIMRWLGVSFALMVLPLLMVGGFIGLAIAGSLSVLVAVEVTFKAVQRAIMRPARETLFTVVSREDKYKSKAVTDTFVYRGGDVMGAWSEGLLRSLGMGLAALASVAVPLSLAWAVLGVWLGRRQITMAAPSENALALPEQPGATG